MKVRLKFLLAVAAAAMPATACADVPACGVNIFRDGPWDSFSSVGSFSLHFPRHDQMSEIPVLKYDNTAGKQSLELSFKHQAENPTYLVEVRDTDSGEIENKASIPDTHGEFDFNNLAIGGLLPADASALASLSTKTLKVYENGKLVVDLDVYFTGFQQSYDVASSLSRKETERKASGKCKSVNYDWW